MSKLGTYENPITVSGVERAYLVCKCSRCGDISMCTPSHDFYTRELDPVVGSPIFGQCCLFSEDRTVVVEDFSSEDTLVHHIEVPWRPYDPSK